jgi:ABC-type phosphate/phosphonate transport system permease subunit
VEGITSWFDYMSTRTDLIIEGLTQTLTYVVVVTLAAGITAVVVAILTMRHTFAIVHRPVPVRDHADLEKHLDRP